MTSCPEGFRMSSRCQPGGLGRRLLSLGPGAGLSPCGPPGRDCTRSAGRLRVGSTGHQADTGPGRWPRRCRLWGFHARWAPARSGDRSRSRGCRMAGLWCVLPHLCTLSQIRLYKESVKTFQKF